MFRFSFVLSCAVGVMAGCGSSRPIAGADGGRDARGLDATGTDRTRDGGNVEARPPGDRGHAADMNLKFPAVLEGVWLVGWYGGMNHFSWVRFAKLVSPSSKADAWILDGKDLSANNPLWSCNGKAAWWMGAAANTAYLDFPSTSCVPSGVSTMGYVFAGFTGPEAGGAPKGAILSATVKDQPTLTPMMGFKFPDTWCDATMTSCKNPF